MTTEETTSLSIMNIGAAEPGAMVTSIKLDASDRATSAKVYNALNNPNEKISAHINEEIEVKDYLVEMTRIQDTDDFDNELETYSDVPRVVLISPDGTSYQAVSLGMATAVRNMIVACGDAPWEPALRIKIKQVPTKKGSMLTVEMVG